MLRSLADVVLTRDAKQRIRLAHSGLASALMVVAVALMHVMTWLGVNDGTGLWPWTAVSAIGLVAMFITIRLGWSAPLRDPSLTVAQLLYAERIRASVEGVSLSSGHAAFGITVSIGVATYRTGDTVAQTLSRADGALYQAKLAGRNRVEASPASALDRA